jgi:outer membrane protein OmpA-like peptidoglycan-associated protein
MNMSQHTGKLLAVASVSLLLAACAGAPTAPTGAAQTRARLTELQANPELATRAPVAIKEPEVAVEADLAQPETEDLKAQIAELNARETERGLVVTLGDLLFETDRAELKGGTANHLDKLAQFLNRHPDRNVIIEGYTDNIGSADYNFDLSQRRAESVRGYLISQGIATSRVSASGKGEYSP